MCVHFFAPNQIASHEDCHVFSEWTPLALDMSVVIRKEYTVICGSSDPQSDSSNLFSWNKYIKTWDEFANSVYVFVLEMKMIYWNNFSFNTLKTNYQAKTSFVSILLPLLSE